MQQSTMERKLHSKVAHNDNKDTKDASCHCLLSKQTCLPIRTLGKVPNKTYCKTKRNRRAVLRRLVRKLHISLR